MDLNDKQQQLLKTLTVMLLDEKDLTEDIIVRKAEFLNQMYMCSEDEMKGVLDSYESIRPHHKDVGCGIKGDYDQEPWYLESKKNHDSVYWESYRDYLLTEASFSKNVVDAMDSELDILMDDLGDPCSPIDFSRKGLVIGDVQSGKTANYIGLMNKAVDAGYKVIILLTGTIEKLRQQTQERVDAGFIGMDSDYCKEYYMNGKAADKTLGVGHYKSKKSISLALTTKEKDFVKQKLSMVFQLQSYDSSVVFVLKKNVSVFRSLIAWLKKDTDSSNKIHLPMLLIDDEADYASINTKKERDEKTAINKRINELISMFSKVTYVGFTATPYANIFIDPDTDNDLFPQDFIFNLKSPSNYIGPMGIYGGLESDFGLGEQSSNLDEGKYRYILDSIDDFQEYLPLNHKNGTSVGDELPKSLKTAVMSFFIANAIRDLRGDVSKHRTMLVNVSRFISVQNELTSAIDTYVRDLVRVIKNYSKLPEMEALKHPELQEIKKVFDSRYLNLPDVGYSFPKYTWIDIQHALYAAVSSITVRSVNGGNASQNLDYDAYSKKKISYRLIAVGGFSLSRGLTLEGLIISYYYRNSKMYDTLMQMGRWFGYRPGYADLCRVWMSDDSAQWYSYIAYATEELKRSIVSMRGEKKTPRDFGLRVRSDNVSLFVTARNKMRTATDYEYLISLSQTVQETKYLVASPEVYQSNYGIVDKWLKDVLSDHDFWDSDERAYSNRYQIKNVPTSKIVELISEFHSSGRNTTFISKDLSTLIEAGDDITPYWDVVIATGNGIPYTIGGIELNGVERGFALTSNGKDIQVSGRSAHMGSVNVYKSGETKEYVKKIKRLADKDGKVNQEDYFRLKRNPLLVIWPLELTHLAGNSQAPIPEQVEKLKALNIPAVGLSFGYPKLSSTDAIKVSKRYKLNKVFCANIMEEDSDEVDFDEEMGLKD